MDNNQKTIRSAVFIDVESLVSEVIEGIERHSRAIILRISHTDGKGISCVGIDLQHGLLDLRTEAFYMRFTASLINRGKLVTAKSGEEDARVLCGNALERICDAMKCRIALYMTEIVVDALEIVNIHHYEPEGLLSVTSIRIGTHLLCRIAIESVTVVESCEHIVGNSVILELLEYDERARSDAKAVQGEPAVGRSLQKSKAEDDQAEP